MEYGLIGAKLGHSYSKIIHERLGEYAYELCPLPTEEEARAFLEKRNRSCCCSKLCGRNCGLYFLSL